MCVLYIISLGLFEKDNFSSSLVHFEQGFLLHILLATFFVVTKVEFLGEASTTVFTLERPLSLVNMLLVFI
jgi:hypothetical protein